MVQQGKPTGAIKELTEYKKFRKEMEAIGIDIHRGSIKRDDDELLAGLSFEASVDLVRFLNSIDPDDTKYPRTRENYKRGLFTVVITRNSDEWFGEYTMDVRVQDTLDERKEDPDDIEKLCVDVIEGGDEVDKIAEVSTLILNTARQKAKELYTKVK